MGNDIPHVLFNVSIAMLLAVLVVVVKPLSMFLPGMRGLDKGQSDFFGRHMSIVLDPTVIP